LQITVPAQHFPHGSFEKKIEAKYLLFALPTLDYKFGNRVMQSRFACGPQLRIYVISIISELYFIASGSVLSHVIYFLLTMAQPKKQVRTLHDQSKVIEEVEKNPGEKRVDIAKRLGLSATTLNSIFAKKDEIREQIEKCGNTCKKRKTDMESTFAELETVLFTWYQQARASNIPTNGTTLREKVKIIAAQLNTNNFSASSDWVSRFKDRHGLVFK
jgi:hypothetical protein